MPTNQEWLHKLANESPDELKAWFDAEHNDTFSAKNDVSGDSAHSNDGNAHLKAHSKTEPMLSEQSGSLSEGLDSREKLETDVRLIVHNILSDGASMEADPSGDYMVSRKWEPDDSIVNAWTDVLIPRFDRQAAITERETFNHYRDELERRANREQKLQEQVDRLTAERDNLAKDLNDMMRSMDKLRDRFRDASSSALDNAHEIQRIIDNFWTV